MKITSIIFLLALLGLAGACKKEEVPLQQTLMSVQVTYQSTGQPVDSANVTISGTKGSVLTGREIQTFFDGYTDKQGHLEASMLIPRDWNAFFTCGKLVKIGTRYKLYGVESKQPDFNFLKHEQENNITVQLDTLK